MKTSLSIIMIIYLLGLFTLQAENPAQKWYFIYDYKIDNKITKSRHYEVSLHSKRDHIFFQYPNLHGNDSIFIGEILRGEKATIIYAIQYDEYYYRILSGVKVREGYFKGIWYDTENNKGDWILIKQYSKDLY